MKDKEIAFYKLLAVGAAILYLYKVMQKNGGTLSGNPYGINVNADKIAGLASNFVPNPYKAHAQRLGSVVLSRILH